MDDTDDTPPTVWNSEPILIRWQVESWEHAVCDPGSKGISGRVYDSKRLLPIEFTAPIYALLDNAERLIMRYTEPMLPYDARLLREPKFSMKGEGCSPLMARVAEILGGHLRDVVPDWDEEIISALNSVPAIREKHLKNFACLGIPRGASLLSDGYRLSWTPYSGSAAGKAGVTHQTLLMGCAGQQSFQPGILREFMDCLMR